MSGRKDRRYRVLIWVALAVSVLATDFWTGPYIRFPIFYLVPISLAAWSDGPIVGMLLAVAMPLIHLGYSAAWEAPEPFALSCVNTAIRVLVMGAFAYLTSRVADQKRQLETEIQTLKGILPICSFCKNIRDAEGNWSPLEHYISSRSEARFSHGICPECLKRHYGEHMADFQAGPTSPARR